MIQRPLQALSDTSIHSFGELKGNLTSFHMRVPTHRRNGRVVLFAIQITTRLRQHVEERLFLQNHNASGIRPVLVLLEDLSRWLFKQCVNRQLLLLGDANLAEEAAGRCVLLEDVQHALPDLTRLLRGVDLLPDAGVAVVVDDGAGLLVVGTKALAESALVIVGALDERLAGNVVDHVSLRGVEDLVVRAARGGVHETTGDTGDKKLVGDLELDGVLQRLRLGLKHAVELDSLGNGAREAIKDEAGRCVSTASPCASFHKSSYDVPVLTLLVVVQLILDHANHDLVRHQLALVHNLLGLATKLGLSSDLRAKHVAGGQVAGAVLLLDLWGLSTLACWRCC